jgi:hypothetical protein
MWPRAPVFAALAGVDDLKRGVGVAAAFSI